MSQLYNNTSKKLYVESFVKLGEFLKVSAEDEALLQAAYNKNAWFRPENSATALLNWSLALQESKVIEWLNRYNQNNTTPKKVGIVSAGNIPLVGLHDLLCVLASGHKALIKLSKDDEVLMTAAITMLTPHFEADSIEIRERLNDSEAIIATGSNNTARYFSYYFKDRPSLIRHHRSSVAIIKGDETKEELGLLTDDICQYFGLGCRNVSKIYLPEGYELTRVIDAIEAHSYMIDHHKYANNYTYHKAIFLMNRTQHLDNGFMLFKEDERIHSPLSVLYYTYYSDNSSLQVQLQSHEQEIQIRLGSGISCLPFGTSQQTGLMDYADNVDVMDFLQTI